MSRFMSERHAALIPYVPGEQPRDMQYIKLNTNESPFPPSPLAIEKASEEAKKLELYPDPDATELTRKMAETLGVSPSEVLLTNGSDEILNFAFMAFGDESHHAAFADITYGFYSVFAEINHIPYEEIPLRADFTIDGDDYIGIGKNIFIANPNAPTGISLSLAEIEKIVASNPDNVVVIDEAYVDFGGESAVGLIRKYDNLLVTGTFSKSRSMAGARLGYGVASEALIRDLITVKYSTNPYNVNRMTMAAGLGVLADADYTGKNCQTIIQNRTAVTQGLEEMGFTVLPSKTNFVFARHPAVSGEALYRKLKQRGILVRHFTKDRIKDFNRITIGTMEQMDALLRAVCEILEEVK